MNVGFMLIDITVGVGGGGGVEMVGYKNGCV